MNPTLILPKGRLYNDIQKFFQLKGFLLPDENSRQYYFPNWFEECNLFIAKPKAIPQLLYSKMAEFAFCGNDIINNSDYNQSIYPIYSTGLNKIKICLCSRLDKETLLHLKRPVIVASEFEIIASRYFTNLGVPHYIINTGGSTEGYLDLNVDCIIDVVDTGKTLKDNNISIIDILFKSETTLFGHIELMDSWFPNVINKIIEV
jgi:ATP phosphoribosyltransferase|uniref:ATP phosphoribosyltransferase n=1 Tax=Myoviridae sp. ctNQV2 TaxID=2827683 RepID=A0A8S5RY03_9CAUD|nr:MAG TPA: ATP phosphoribosyltransferase [Myoviridae sp. ctNQV2]